MTSLGARIEMSLVDVQWKKYLTTMQIVQFIIDLFIVYFGSKQL